MVNSTCSKYGKKLRCLNTKGKHGKLTGAEIKWSIISKSVMIIIFVEFIDQLIDYPIDCASLKVYRKENGKSEKLFPL